MEILQLKSTITKMKNLLERFNSTLELAEERSHELKDRSIEIMQSEELRGKK